MTHVLVQMPHSPWSERARWALDWHRIPYRVVGWLPGPAELWLRWRLGWPAGPVSVPVLLADDGAALADSAAIARWADAHGGNTTLFPEGADVWVWHEQANAMLAAGRVLSGRSVMADDAALTEMMPPVARLLGPVGRALARSATRALLRKYDPVPTTDTAAVAAIRAVLDAVRPAIQNGDHLVGALSWADISVAAALAFVAPPDALPGLGPLARRAWTMDALASEYADVLAWRDRIYRRHRRP